MPWTVSFEFESKEDQKKYIEQFSDKWYTAEAAIDWLNEQTNNLATGSPGDKELNGKKFSELVNRVDCKKSFALLGSPAKRKQNSDSKGRPKFEYNHAMLLAVKSLFDGLSTFRKNDEYSSENWEWVKSIGNELSCFLHEGKGDDNRIWNSQIVDKTRWFVKRHIADDFHFMARENKSNIDRLCHLETTMRNIANRNISKSEDIKIPTQKAPISSPKEEWCDADTALAIVQAYSYQFFPEEEISENTFREWVKELDMSIEIEPLGRPEVKPEGVATFYNFALIHALRQKLNERVDNGLKEKWYTIDEAIAELEQIYPTEKISKSTFRNWVKEIDFSNDIKQWGKPETKTSDPTGKKGAPQEHYNYALVQALRPKLIERTTGYVFNSPEKFDPHRYQPVDNLLGDWETELKEELYTLFPMSKETEISEKPEDGTRTVEEIIVKILQAIVRTVMPRYFMLVGQNKTLVSLIDRKEEYVCNLILEERKCKSTAKPLSL